MPAWLLDQTLTAEQGLRAVTPDSNGDLRQGEAEVVVKDEDRALLDGEPSEGTLELVSIVDSHVIVGPVHRLDRQEPNSLRPARATPLASE
jgi:hypothetical protein